MVISVSRRTDIPAFYGEWFINRLRAGEVLVKNPMNPGQISTISLNPDSVDCIVFWTKNPGNFLQYLDEIDSLGFKYYFQFTLNSYGKDIESGVDSKTGIINTFKTLSDKIGSGKVIWRYDPILFNNKYNLEYHTKWYKYLSDNLKSYTNECVISFLEVYRKIKKNAQKMGVINPDSQLVHEIAGRFGEISHLNGIRLSTCSQDLDLSSYKIGHSRCIDGELIERIIGKKLKITKDKGQRDACGCMKSRDIGSYNTCRHFCKYCYANCSNEGVARNINNYDPASPLLC